MDPRCAATVRAAAGDRKISDAKLDQIETLLRSKGSELARRDRARWQGLPVDARTMEAAQAVMQDIEHAAARKEINATLQVLKQAETDSRVERQMELTPGTTRSQAVVQDIVNTHNTIAAVRNDGIAHLGDMIDAAENKQGATLGRRLLMSIFDMDNPIMTKDVVREVFRLADGSTGNKAAQAGAKAWLDTIERMRLRFNAAGGDVGKLDYGYLGQAHDQGKVRATSADDWANKVLPLLDRERYVDPEGRLLNDDQLRQVLRAAHETLATGGDNKIEPGAFKGSGGTANKGSDHRVLHFQDGDAWIQYMADFGQGSLYDSMLGHVGKMSRDIGLVESYGPNPNRQFERQADLARRADVKDTGGDFLNARSAGNTPQAYWDILTGVTGTPGNSSLSRGIATARNIQTAAKLGGAVITSLTDASTIASTLHYNKLPYFDMLKNIGKQMDGDTKSFLQSHGVIGEALAGSLNRWTGDNLTHSLSGRLASAVMKASLMNAWTDGLRNAFSLTMMGGMARMAKKDWGTLAQWDRYLLEKKGITEADWAIISKAEPTEHSGGQYLTAEGVRATGVDGAEQAANKVLAYVNDEAQFAVLNPDMATRAIATGGGLPAGTIRGEAMRSFAQFKSFPIAMMTRHWRRMFDTPQGMEGAPSGYGATTTAGKVANRMALMAGLSLSGMLLGGVVVQVKSMLQGKDPRDMTDPKFWGQAMAQGGGFGYLGDFLFKDPTEQRGSSIEQGVGSILGPLPGAAAGVAGDLLWKNGWEFAKGKDPHAGAEALRWATANTPGASLWWSRPAFDHWFLYSAQEALNPGYLGRMQQRAMKDFHQEYYWSPNDGLPARGPDLKAAVGGH